MMRSRRVFFTIILMCAGALMLFAGIVSGEPSSVMRKAVYICLECIGIG